MARGTATSPEMVARIIELYNTGVCIPVVVEQLGVHKSTVYNALRTAGVDTSKKRRRPSTTKRTRLLWQNRPDGADIDAAIRAEYGELGPLPIATRFGLTEAMVSMRAWRLGVKCTTAMVRKSATVAANNTSVNQQFFETWSPNLAWLLGYTWTDGAVSSSATEHKVHYRCSIVDEHIIHDIMKTIRSTAAVQRYKATKMRNGYVSSPQVGFSISSISIVQLFIDRYGIPPNKSNLDPPMPEVANEWMPHFTRGVIDGDGSICGTSVAGRIQIVLYGSHRFIESMRHRVSACAGVKLPNRSRCGSSDKLSRISWSATADVTRLLRWLYPKGDYLFLCRKREIADAYLAGRKLPGSGIAAEVDTTPAPERFE